MIEFKQDKVLVIFALAYGAVLLANINNPHHVDESTHSFVGLFFKDFANDWIKSPTFSFNKIYDYALSYLAFYPKLSLHYPPLPQLMFSVAYGIFGVSLQTSRFVIILSSLALLVVVYYFALEVFKSRKIALIASSLLMTAPIIINMSILSMQEIPFVLFFTLTMMWLYLIKKSPNVNKFVILSVLIAATTLTKWQAVTIFPVILIYALIFERKILRPVLFSILVAIVIIAPYYFLLWKTNLLLIPLSANLEADPLDPTWIQFEGWTYYITTLIKDQFFLPVGAIIFVGYLAYARNGLKEWKFFTTWISVVFFMMVVAHNKDPRYTINYLPAFVIPAAYAINEIFKRHWKGFLIMTTWLIFVQSVVAFNNLIYGFPEVEEISQYLNLDREGNVLVDTGLGTESPFIFEMARSENFERQILRPCIIEFLNESSDELVKKFGIKYVIVDKKVESFSERQKLFTDKIKNSGNFTLEKDFIRFSIYRNDVYEPKEVGEICNYVCATREFACTRFKTPSEALK